MENVNVILYILETNTFTLMSYVCYLSRANFKAKSYYGHCWKRASPFAESEASGSFYLSLQNNFEEKGGQVNYYMCIV